MRSYVDVKNECLILVADDNYIYEIPYQGDWIVKVLALKDGEKVCMPGVRVLGLDVELSKILQDRGLQHKW